jgi:acyl dehydratase
MPEVQQKTIFLNGHRIEEGKTLVLGVICNSEAEIIAFAKAIDPLPMHTDPEAARKGFFGGIIASGAMLYFTAHKRWFIPMFEPAIICGLGMRNWNFSKPHYPDRSYHAYLTPRQLILHPGKDTVQVEWYYEFRDEDGGIVQDLELPVLHRADRKP